MLDLGNTTQLVVGFGVGEVIFEFRLPGRVGGKGKAGLVFTCGIELDEFTGHILGGFAGLGLCLLPGIGTDLVQTDSGVFSAADIFTHQVQLGCRYKQCIAALVGDFDIIFNGSIHLDSLHGNKAADTIIFMDNQIPGSQIGEGVKLLPVGGRFLCGFLFDLSFGDQLAFC